MSVTRVVRWTTDPALSASFRAALGCLADSARRSASCETFLVLEVSHAPGRFITYERWSCGHERRHHHASVEAAALLRRLHAMTTRPGEANEWLDVTGAARPGGPWVPRSTPHSAA